MKQLRSFADLLELQEVDSRIDRLVDDRRNLPELAQRAEVRRAAAAAAEAFEGASSRLRSMDRDLARIEDELKMAEQKLAKQERRLFAGGMNAKETQNMRMEVDGLRRQASAMEDDLLDLLEQREGLHEEEQESGARATSTSEIERRVSAQVDESLAAIDASIRAHRERRTTISDLVEPSLMRLYTRLRDRRGGIVVGATEGRVCGACHLEMSIAEYEEVIKDTIPQCIQCAAILVL